MKHETILEIYVNHYSITWTYG